MRRLLLIPPRVVKLFRVLGPVQAIRFLGVWILGKAEFRARVRGSRTALLVRPRHTDINCLWQIFGGLDVKLPGDAQPAFIIDGGANVGYASVYFANAYPNARVIAVEPEQGNVDVLRRNVAPYPQVEVVHGGIWSETARLKIQNPDAPSWSFSMVSASDEDQDAIAGYSIPDLMQRSGANRIGLLKLDVEGGERELFTNGLDRWIDLVDVVQLEIHGSEAHDAVFSAIRNLDFAVSYQGEKVLLTRKA